MQPNRAVSARRIFRKEGKTVMPLSFATEGEENIIKQVGGHVEVYSSTGAFLFSADNTREAMEELAG